MFLLLILLSFIGFCVSLYAYSVEQKLKKDPNYQPACNLSDTVSCTKPFESPYGKLLGFSNSILGMIYYPLMAVLSIIGNNVTLLVLSSASLLVTAYMAYILFTKIKSLCLICLTIYAVNISIFLVCLRGITRG